MSYKLLMVHGLFSGLARLAAHRTWPTSSNGHARKLALSRLHDDRSARRDRQCLVDDHIAVDLEAALRDEPKRLGRRLDDARMLRELRHRDPRAAAMQRHFGHRLRQRPLSEARVELQARALCRFP